jgi:hypothetical protein
MRRRVRKYGKRLANYPRAVVAVPTARATRAVMRRRQGARLGAGRRSVLLLCIYRADNARYVASLVDEAVPRGWDVRLWALDRVVPGLERHTVGVSTGAKFPLLNGMVADTAADRFDWIVVADDDIVFDHASVDDLLAVAEAAGLDLVQPAHSELSHRENEIARRRPGAIARRTTFVEIGPLFAVRHPWAAEIVPFPADATMGWGLELEWFDLGRRGLRLGIVDAVAVRHVHPVGKDYAKREQLVRMKALLHERGLGSIHDVQQTLGTWRPWQAMPSWDQ